jgi:hypothetical protein
MPNYIQIQPNSSGLKVDTSELVVGTTTVERQNICFTDPVSAAAIANVQTKANQGVYALAVQDLKDSGRASVCLSSELGGTANWTFSGTEAMANVVVSKIGVAQTNVASYTVTAGKTLRIQSFVYWAYASIAYGVVLNLRANPAGGAVSLSSNILLQIPMVPTNWLTVSTMAIPDGLEIAGGTSIGVSGIAYSSSTQIWGSFIGYEY